MGAIFCHSIRPHGQLLKTASSSARSQMEWLSGMVRDAIANAVTNFHLLMVHPEHAGIKDSVKITFVFPKDRRSSPKDPNGLCPKPHQNQVRKATL